MNSTPFYKSWTSAFNIKWLSVKIFIITTLSYLLGAHKIFAIALPVYILATVYFTIIILAYNEQFFIYGFGDDTYRAYDITLRREYLKNNPDTVKLISWTLWILHIIPLIIFIVWYNRLKSGIIAITGIDDPWLYLRKNRLIISVLAIVLTMGLILMTPANLPSTLNSKPPFFHGFASQKRTTGSGGRELRGMGVPLHGANNPLHTVYGLGKDEPYFIFAYPVIMFIITVMIY